MPDVNPNNISPANDSSENLLPYISISLSEYGNRRKYIWFGLSNDEQIVKSITEKEQTVVIDGVKREDLEKELETHDARSKITKWFYSFFTAIEHRRSLLRYHQLKLKYQEISQLSESERPAKLQELNQWLNANIITLSSSVLKKILSNIMNKINPDPSIRNEEPIVFKGAISKLFKKPIVKLQELYDSLKITRGEELNGHIASYIELRSSNEFQDATDQSHLDYETRIKIEQLDYKILRLCVLYITEIETNFLHKLHQFWLQDNRCLVEDRTNISSQNLSDMANFINQQLLFNAQITRLEIPANKKQVQFELRVIYYFLNCYINKMTTDPFLHSEISPNFVKLYVQWENIMYQMLCSTNAFDDDIHRYIRSGEIFRAAIGKFKIQLDATITITLMKNHQRQLSVMLEDAPGKQERAVSSSSICPLEYILSWYEQEYAAACSGATAAQLAEYQLAHEKLHKQLAQFKEAAKSLSTSSHSSSQTSSERIDPLTATSSAGQFIADHGNKVFQLINQIVDNLKQHTDDPARIKPSEIPAIKESLEQWQNIKKSTHPDKNREDYKSSTTFFGTVIAPLNELIAELRAIPSSKELGEIITKLEGSLQENLTTVIQDQPISLNQAAGLEKSKIVLQCDIAHAMQDLVNVMKQGNAAVAQQLQELDIKIALFVQQVDELAASYKELRKDQRQQKQERAVTWDVLIQLHYILRDRERASKTTVQLPVDNKSPSEDDLVDSQDETILSTDSPRSSGIDCPAVFFPVAKDKEADDQDSLTESPQLD